MSMVYQGAVEVFDPGELRFAPLPVEAAEALAGTLERGAGKAFAAANARRQQARSSLFGLSMSSLGGCTRQAAYRVAGVDPDPQYVAVMSEEEARAAMIGTWIHDGLLPELAELLYSAEAEMRVEMVVPVGPVENGVTPLVKIDGSTDCYTRAAGGGVIDVKSVGAYKLGDIEAHGARERHRKQVRGYASALVQMGMSVAWTGWLYLDRGDGQVKAVVEPFGREEYEATVRRVQYLVTLAEDPDYAPRDERGPGLSWVCDGCPFLRRCWGPQAEPGDSRAIAVHDAEDIAFAAQQVIELREQRAELDKRMDFFKAQVGRPEAGQYGGATVTYGRDGEKIDAKGCARRLQELGEKVPMVPNPGNTYIRRVKQTKGKGKGKR